MPIWKITYAGGVHIQKALTKTDAVIDFERLYPGKGKSIEKVVELVEQPLMRRSDEQPISD